MRVRFFEMGDVTIEGRLRGCLSDAPDEVVCAYLFSSVARDQATPRSDVDVAVLFDPPPPQRLEGARSISKPNSSGRRGARFN